MRSQVTDIAIETFVNSGSFDSAYRNGVQALLPSAKFFDETQLKKILDGSLTNNHLSRINQILNAGGMESVFVDLYAATIRVNDAKTCWRNFWGELPDRHKSEYEALKSALALDDVIDDIPF